MNHSAKEPVSFEDLHDDSFDAPQSNDTNADIRRNAHMVNGGDAVFPCPKCRGTGMTRWGKCFKCSGKGNISKGQAAAVKGKATKEANRVKWAEEHAPEIAYMRKRIENGSNYYYGFQVRLDAHGSLFNSTLEIIRKDMAKDAEFFAAKKAEKQAENAAKSGTVGVEAIDALFATATANGLKKPIFRTERLTIKRAPAGGRNAGALYVTDRDLGGEYVGKIVNGKFEARREAKPDTLKLLCEIAGDPMEAAVRYGRSTGTCCICARELTDADSVAAGIGPICANKFFG